MSINGPRRAVLDRVRGDALGLEFPAHPEALRAGGADFLTRAFRTAGTLGEDNSVVAITRCEELSVGSTGRKLLLDVEYEHPAPELYRELFVKFSRDFDDLLRDRARTQMQLEVRFALLSLQPGFPIEVAKCYFADFHADTGTGILVSRRLTFGAGGIEPHYGKCLDYHLPDALEHYRAIVRSLARLAGSHKAGRLPPEVEQYFPFAPEKLAVSRRAPYTPEQIRRRVARYADFATAYPALLPAHICSREFIARLAEEAPRLQELGPAVQQVLAGNPDLVALCHWNANVDNAWFWRDAGGALHCGLLDWGNVSQMNVAMSLWGSLSCAELDLWDAHLGELLQLFAREFGSSGGPALDVAELELHLKLYAGLMGLAWMLDSPALLLRLVPDLGEVADRRDPRIEGNEAARAQLHLLQVFMNLWAGGDYAGVLAEIESRTGGQP